MTRMRGFRDERLRSWKLWDQFGSWQLLAQDWFKHKMLIPERIFASEGLESDSMSRDDSPEVP